MFKGSGNSNPARRFVVSQPWVGILQVVEWSGVMELLLNLLWLLLLVPACWIWRRERKSSMRCLLALGCALVVLFPVISATDDLHAAPQAMEDSTSIKRTLRNCGIQRTCDHSNFPVPPAYVNWSKAIHFAAEACGRLLEDRTSANVTTRAEVLGIRPPPTHS